MFEDKEIQQNMTLKRIGGGYGDLGIQIRKEENIKVFY